MTDQSPEAAYHYAVIRRALDIIDAAGAKPAGVVIALDREERGKGERSAIQEVESDYGIPVASIVRLRDLIDFVSENESARTHLAHIQAYREEYGV